MDRAPRLIRIAMTLLVAFATTPFAGAIEELRARAEKGDAAAQFNLGVMCPRGQGAPKNLVEGAKWYRKAVVVGSLDLDGGVHPSPLW